MLALIFDVETTGLPKKRKAELFHFNNWPDIVQISWMIYNVSHGKIVSINDHIIKLQPGKTIPKSSTEIHGITNDIMEEKGEDIVNVLKKFNND